VSLDWFVFIGTFIEELISPIPSFLVMVPAGVAAQAQGGSIWFLLWLSIIAGIARIIAGTILYFLADKLEDIIFAKGRSFFGMTHKSVEGFGKKLSGKHAKHTWLAVFLFSALPFLPTATLSLTCGFIKIRYKTFATANFFGSIFNSMFYLGVGYYGLEAAKLISKLELTGQIIAGVAVIAVITWLLWRKYQKPKRASK
jgi:membrane protein DedA with SNARE-associated domain